MVFRSPMLSNDEVEEIFTSAYTIAIEQGYPPPEAARIGTRAVGRASAIAALRYLEADVDASPAVTWTGPGGIRDRLHGALGTIQDWS
ncbi:hypothetical protein GCM10009807_24160 [Microbacterium lacus]|uniref:Uncharacterized protein n=1 Tax=Microbacterium lacus TaxID=415217 RepID=A0ABP4SYR9_9MICO